jgi:hypothetical protein
MKPLFLTLLAVFAIATPHAFAQPPMSRTLQGEIVIVEPHYKRFTVRTLKYPAGFTLSWGPQTKFIRGDESATPDSLKRGQQVAVYYRWPSFGPKIASRVFILSDSK